MYGGIVNKLKNLLRLFTIPPYSQRPTMKSGDYIVMHDTGGLLIK